MQQKITEYVNYQFRFDTREGLEELKLEIISNLVDRYQALLKEGKNENDAYIEAIKSMGDFSANDYNKVEPEYSDKPSLPDIGLISGTVFSIFGLILVFVNNTAGAIVTALSIVCYSGGAFYLYSYSQYVKKHDLDIEKHNLLLKKIFKYMKTNFVFWSISISFIIASIILGIVQFVMALGLISNPVDIPSVIGAFIFISFIIFMFSLVILLSIFNNIYKRLLHRYYILTGETYLHGKIKESYNYLYGKEYKDIKKSSIISPKYLVIVWGVVILLLNSFIRVFINYKTNAIDQISPKNDNIYVILIKLLMTEDWFAVIGPILISIAIIVCFILVIKDKIKIYWLIVLYLLYSVSIVVINNLIQLSDNIDSITHHGEEFNNFLIILTSFGFIIWFMFAIIEKNRQKG